MSGLGLWIWVALGGGAGAVARLVVDGHVLERTGGRLPWGTVFINLSGALALGVIAGVSPSHAMVLIAGTVFLGAYTTFSTWMLESLMLAETGRARAAVWNLAGQLVAGVGVAALGFAVGLQW
jgi:CrcB protein